MQIGRAWIKDKAGRRTTVTPATDLALGDLLRWLGQQAYKGVREHVGDELEDGNKRNRVKKSAARAAAKRTANAVNARTLLASPCADDRLTPAQQRILRLTSKGLTVKEVAAALRVAEATVRVQQRLARLRINEKCTLETNTLDERGLSSRRRQNERSGQKERGHQTGRGKR